MKKPALQSLITISLLALFIGGIIAFAADDRNYSTEPAYFLISDVPLKIMAERKASAKPWVNGQTYGHGDTVRSTSNTSRVYWNVSGTTNLAASTTMPNQAWGDSNDGSTNVWRRVMPRSRLGFVVQNLGTGNVYLAVGHVAVEEAGIWLKPEGAYFVDGEWMQDFVYAVGTTNAITNRVVVQEW